MGAEEWRPLLKAINKKWGLAKTGMPDARSDRAVVTARLGYCNLVFKIVCAFFAS